METVLTRPTVRLDREGRLGWLWLTRPEKLNAFTLQMWDELREVGEGLLADPQDLRALVVIGTGRAFSSGIDTTVFSDSATGGAGAERSSGQPARHDDPVVDAVMRTADAFNWLERAPFPSIAAVRGYALGAGLQLALACDLRLLARGTQVGLLELNYGILPDLGGTQRLPRLVGAGKAKELILTGAKLDAEEAFRVGIAEQLVDDGDLELLAGRLGAKLAAQPPLAVRGVKRAVAAAGDVPVETGLRVEAEAQAACLRSADMREAIAAFVEQREPQYRGE